MNIFCVIVTFNGIKWIDKCLNSIQLLDCPVNVIVVDNGSTDGTDKFIVKDFPSVQLIKLNENIGFGNGNNIGITMAMKGGAEYVFLLNQDVYIRGGSLIEITTIMKQNTTLGIISPFHFMNDGKTFDYKFHQYLKWNCIPDPINDIKSGKLKDFYITKFVNAAAWVIDTRMLKRTGLFHPIFFLYLEDMEFAHRIKTKGYQMAVSPKLSIIHDRAQCEKVPNLELKIIYYENSIYWNYLIKRKSLFYITSFMILSIGRDMITFRYSLGLKKIKEFPLILNRINLYGHTYTY